METASTSSKDDVEEEHASGAPRGLLFTVGEGYRGRWSWAGQHAEEDGAWWWEPWGKAVPAATSRRVSPPCRHRMRGQDDLVVVEGSRRPAA